VSLKAVCQLELDVSLIETGFSQLEDEVWRLIVADWQTIVKSRNLESRNQILNGLILINFI
jgi:hypothetical protein